MFMVFLKTCPVLCILLVGGGSAPSLLAQTINPDSRAVCAFSIDVAKLKKSCDSSFTNLLERAPDISGFRFLVSADSISGSFSLPENPVSTDNAEFFIRLDFPDAATASSLWDVLSEPEELSLGSFEGLPCLTHEDWPESNYVLLSPTAVAWGTPLYLNPMTRELHSGDIQKRFKNLPDGSIRVALDLSSPHPFITQSQRLLTAIQAGEAPEELGELTPEDWPFLAAPLKIEWIEFSADLQSDELCKLIIRGRDEEVTNELCQALTGLLKEPPSLSYPALTELLEQSSTESEFEWPQLPLPRNEGNQVVWEVPTPKGMGEMIRKRTFIPPQKLVTLYDEKRIDAAYAAICHFYWDEAKSAFQALPITDDSGEPMRDELSWRTRVLPYLHKLGDAGRQLYRQLDRGSSHDSPVNQKLSDQMPDWFGTDSRSLSDIVHIERDEPNADLTLFGKNSDAIMLIQYKPGRAWLDPRGLTIDEALQLFSDLKAEETLLTISYNGTIRRFSKSAMTAEQFRAALLHSDD